MPDVPRHSRRRYVEVTRDHGVDPGARVLSKVTTKVAGDAALVGDGLALAQEPRDLVTCHLFVGYGVGVCVSLVVSACDEGRGHGRAVVSAGPPDDIDLLGRAERGFYTSYSRAPSDRRSGFSRLHDRHAPLVRPLLDAVVEVGRFAKAADEQDRRDAVPFSGDGLQLPTNQYQDLVDDGVEQRPHLLSRDEHLAVVYPSLLDSVHRWHADVVRALALAVAEGAFYRLEVLDYALLCFHCHRRVPRAETGLEELFEVAVDVGRPAKVASAHRAFGHAEVGVDADDGIGD